MCISRTFSIIVYDNTIMKDFLFAPERHCLHCERRAGTIDQSTENRRFFLFKASKASKLNESAFLKTGSADPYITFSSQLQLSKKH